MGDPELLFSTLLRDAAHAKLAALLTTHPTAECREVTDRAGVTEYSVWSGPMSLEERFPDGIPT